MKKKKGKNFVLALYSFAYFKTLLDNFLQESNLTTIFINSLVHLSCIR